MHLPFKDESFNAVFSSHTIEHVQNPLLMLREMCRVANEKIVVRCMHLPFWEAFLELCNGHGIDTTELNKIIENYKRRFQKNFRFKVQTWLEFRTRLKRT